MGKQWVEFLVTMLVCLLAAAPFVVAGLRSPSPPWRWMLIGLSALVVVLTTCATGLDSIFGFRQPDWLHWNWIGKLAAIATIALLEMALPEGGLRKSGMLSLPARDSWRPVALCLVVCALVGGSAAFDPDLPADGETLAFQSLMPSLSEEPVYRAMVPTLLIRALGSPWKVGGAFVGWWWPGIAVLFGAGHGIAWSFDAGLKFAAVPFVFTGVVALWLGWLAVRCGSLWPCLLAHTLLNATGRAIVAVSRLL
jgi:hypothetical protein